MIRKAEKSAVDQQKFTKEKFLVKLDQYKAV